MNVHCVAVMAWPIVVRPDTRLTGGKLACSGSSPEMSPKPTRSPHRLQRCPAWPCLSITGYGFIAEHVRRHQQSLPDLATVKKR